jgi:hypothetical protein
MSQGYLVMAQGDFIEHAHALAQSIQDTQSSVAGISIITDRADLIDRSLFEHVIPLDLDQDLAKDSVWKIHNRCRFFELTPYDETVILDADMLFLEDVSHWWNHFAKFDMLFTSNVLTYRREWVRSSPYRKAFVANKLPNLYSAYAYFKKTDTAESVFALARSIIVNWDEWINRYAPEEKQPVPSLDLTLSLAIKLMGIENEVTSPLGYPTFTHMKSGCQGWQAYSEDWKTHLGIYKSLQGIRLGDYLQTGILHYVDKNFLKELNK